MFSELESKQKHCKEIVEITEYFDIVLEKKNEDILNINLKILEIQDLSHVNILEKIISALKDGYSVSKKFIFYIKRYILYMNISFLINLRLLL